MAVKPASVRNQTGTVCVQISEGHWRRTLFTDYHLLSWFGAAGQTFRNLFQGSLPQEQQFIAPQGAAVHCVQNFVYISWKKNKTRKTFHHFQLGLSQVAFKSLQDGKLVETMLLFIDGKCIYSQELLCQSKAEPSLVPSSSFFGLSSFVFPGTHARGSRRLLCFVVKRSRWC